MIKRVVVIFRKIGVWARGDTYTVPPTIPYEDGQILLDKSYPKGTSDKEVWEDIREKMIEEFFFIFENAVMCQTAPPKPPTDVKELAITRQSEHVKKRRIEMPEFYSWNPVFKKWHMNPKGYRQRTITYGGPIEISIAEGPYEEMYDYTYLRELEEMMSGMTKSLILFVYPDRYDEIYRAMFEIVFEFY